MKCENFIITLSSVLLMVCVSCSTAIDSNVECTANQTIDYGVLLHKIDSINAVYLGNHNKVTTPIMYASTPGSSSDDNTSLKKKDDNSVLIADATGFVTGTVFSGGLELILVGALAGSFIPGAGTAAGAVGGAVDIVLSGVAWGALFSADAANGNNKDSTQNGTNRHWDLSDWIIYNEDFIFNEDIIGGNVGWCHNDIIQGIWQQYSSDEILDAINNNHFLDYITSYMEYRDICTFVDKEAFCNAITEELTGCCYRDVIDPYYNQIIDGYFETITELDREEWFAYTQSVMEEINGFGLPEDDTYRLNGTLSTFYYSSILWNMDAVNNIPPEE